MTIEETYRAAIVAAIRLLYIALGYKSRQEFYTWEKPSGSDGQAALTQTN